MNYIKHLTSFFDKIINDYSLNPTHISLYIALFQYWNLNRFQNPISISRDEIMRISKICSKATYHKCIRELHEKGYIKYEPSFNPFKGSIVYLLNLSEQLKPTKQPKTTKPKNKQPNEQPVNKQQTSSGTATEQALVPSINSINNTNITKIINVDKSPNQKKKDPFKNQTTNTKQLCQPTFTITKTNTKTEPKENTQIPPQWEKVEQFFSEKKIGPTEAQKFYNYFQSNGWLIGGKTKMKDWQAAAHNWILNSQKFNKNKQAPQPNHLHTPTHKNYGEPL